tara:strand:+ start:432 stop:1205 length:774 start_codon:yes stop_codon:yes gene_type:complete
MRIKYYLIFIAMLACLGCSDDIKILEDRIKLQADKNNIDMSMLEIKETAVYLNEWSKEDFYQDDVDKFLEEDEANFPEEIDVLFAGSSSIRFWESLDQDMKPLKVLNRGFGGAHIAHVNYHFKDVIQRYKPKAIVFFCGTNDVTALKTPRETVNDFKIFKQKVREDMPGVHIFVIGIKPTPARLYLEKEELEYNKLIDDMSQDDDLLTFVDIWDAMLTSEGKRIPELFIEDGLHINSEGYKIWTTLVRKNLERVFIL